MDSESYKQREEKHMAYIKPEKDDIIIHCEKLDELLKKLPEEDRVPINDHVFDMIECYRIIERKNVVHEVTWRFELFPRQSEA
jgi:hypothetical protein